MPSPNCNAGSPDQNGNYQTGTALAPGKYFAIALRTPVDATPEAVGKLWQARAKAKEVQIAKRCNRTWRAFGATSAGWA